MLDCFTEGNLVCSELGNGFLKPVGIGFGPSGFIHGNRTTRAPNLLRVEKIELASRANDLLEEKE